MIFYKLEEDGGFVCGDSRTGMTSYSYPTSDNARLARRVNPTLVASAKLAKESRYGGKHEADYDARNWAKLTGG
jgi:hypothetical protein